MNYMVDEIEAKRDMDGHDEDDLEDLNSTVCTLPPNVQHVIEQVRIVLKLSNYLQLSSLLRKQLNVSYKLQCIFR